MPCGTTLLEEKQKGSKRRITVGADKAYDTADFVAAARALNVTAHVTQNDDGRRSNLDRRTTAERPQNDPASRLTRSA